MTNKNLQKSLVTIAIEKTILELDGITLLEKVNGILFKKNNASIPDCYDHPEYLNEALKNLYGDGYMVVVEKIKNQLIELPYQEQVSEFIEKIAA